MRRRLAAVAGALRADPVADVVSVVLVVNALFSWGATDWGGWGWRVNLLVLLVAAAAYFHRRGWARGFREGTEFAIAQFEEAHSHIPSDLRFERNDETGEVTALVTKRDGTVVLVPIPAEEAVAPERAVRYVFSQLDGREEEGDG